MESCARQGTLPPVRDRPAQAAKCGATARSGYLSASGSEQREALFFFQMGAFFDQTFERLSQSEVASLQCIFQIRGLYFCSEEKGNPTRKTKKRPRNWHRRDHCSDKIDTVTNGNVLTVAAAGVEPAISDL